MSSVAPRVPPAVGLDAARCIDIPEIVDDRGSLTFGQAGSHIPFVPRRYFTIMNVPRAATRGGHAHRTIEQFIVALRGRVVIALSDGTRVQRTVLDSPRTALYVPAMVWNDLDEISPDAVILCLASGDYDEAEYIRDRATYLQTASAR